MRDLLIAVVRHLEFWMLGYLLVINTIYFMLMVIGLFEIMRRRRTDESMGGTAELEMSALMPPISVLAPAYNEGATIRESVRAMLGLSYPQHEVIVINDGSKDETLQLLIDEFHLYRSARYYDPSLPTEPVIAVYESMDPIPLVVIDKKNGGKADALNAGINVARYPLLCSVDADCLLEREALLRVARPFVEEPDRVIAAGGIIRVANGCGTRSGRVLSVDLPRSWIARFQVVEYLRAFLGGRVALSSFNCLLVISGAFGVFQRRAVLAVGGYRRDTVGEDMELVVRLHHWALESKKDYRIVFQPDPVCWTEVPETLRVLRRQRTRWQRGTIETVWMHRGLLGKPCYGWFGLFGFPYFVLFEMFSPIVELCGYLLTIIGLVFGAFDLRVASLLFMAAVLYGVILSTAAVILEELSLRRYPKVKDMLLMIGAAIVENFGYRQLLALWRFQAFYQLFKGDKSWGAMERKGFQPLPSAPEAVTSPVE